MKTFKRVILFNSGYCRQFQYLAAGAGSGITRFYAVFVYLEHPLHGASIIDTGYSEHFFAETNAFPQRLYRMTTPTQLDPHKNAAGVLAAQNINPETIKTVFISHFHADHIGSVRFFPNAKFVYLESAYQPLLALKPFFQVKNGFLRGLLPTDFAERSRPIPENEFPAGQAALREFLVHDYYQDGSLIMVKLPGHAPGQIGFILNTTPRPVFYAVDAFWHYCLLEEGNQLPYLSRKFQYDYAAYETTLAKLRRLHQSKKFEILACHCPKTQNFIENHK